MAHRTRYIETRSSSSDAEGSSRNEEHEGLGTAEFDNLGRIFDTADVSGDGSLSLQELTGVFERFGFQLSAIEATLILQDNAADPADGLTRDEFTSLVLKNVELFAETPFLQEKRFVSTKDWDLKGVYRSDSWWRRFWDVVVFAATWFFAITVVRGRATSYYPGPWPVDTAGTIILACDVYVNSKTAYLNSYGRLVVNRKDIWQKYLKTWFAVDVLASLPLHTILAVAGLGTASLCAGMLRLLALTKVHRLFLSSNCDYLVDAGYIRFYFYLVPLFKLVSVLLFTVHLCVVISYHLPKEQEWSWISTQYWLWYTISGVGYGEFQILGTSHLEVWSIFLFLFAMVVNGVVVNKLGGALKDRSLRKDLEELMRNMENLLDFFRVPEHLTAHILAHRHYNLRHTLSNTYAQDLNSLPGEVMRGIRANIHSDMLQRVPLLAKASTACVKALSEELTLQQYRPNEFIIVFGEKGNEMFFLNHGVAEVLSKDGVSLVHLQPGSFFGEIALISEGTRTASIRAVTPCDCIRLERSALEGICKRFPKFWDQVKAFSAEQQQKQQKSGTNAPTQAPITQASLVRFYTEKRVIVLGRDAYLDSQAAINTPAASPVLPQITMVDERAPGLFRRGRSNTNRTNRTTKSKVSFANSQGPQPLSARTHLSGGGVVGEVVHKDTYFPFDVVLNDEAELDTLKACLRSVKKLEQMAKTVSTLVTSKIQQDKLEINDTTKNGRQQKQNIQDMLACF